MNSSDYLLYIGIIKCGTALETISAELHTANKIALNKCIDDVAKIIKESQDE